MIRTKEILLGTIIPSTIGTIILVGFFFVDDRLIAREIVESCSDFYLSNTDYLMFILIIAGLGSVFKFATDKILGNRPAKSVVIRHATSILIFALFFLAIFLIAAIVNGKAPDMLTEVMILLLGLGTIIRLVSLTMDKFFLR